jgi:hypothetical protein
MERYEVEKTYSTDEETKKILSPFKRYDGAVMLEQGLFVLLNWGYLLNRENN